VHDSLVGGYRFVCHFSEAMGSFIDLRGPEVGAGAFLRAGSVHEGGFGLRLFVARGGDEASS